MLLPLAEQRELQDYFARHLKGPVHLVVFRHGDVPAADPDNLSAEAEELARELEALSPLLYVRVVDFDAQPTEARHYGISMVPAFAILGDENGAVVDHGIRHYGLPSGFEFSAFLQTLVDVSAADSSLHPEVRTALERLDKHVHLQVYSTPNCVVCPVAAHTAFRFAMQSKWVRTDVISCWEFLSLAEQNAVRSVPHTVVNNLGAFVGAKDEYTYLENILEHLGAKP
jgi:glutaredoxin-like protein